MVPRFFTSKEVAELVQMSPSAVLRWIDSGMLAAYRTPGGHRRVGSAELVAFLKNNRMPVPEALDGARVRLLVIDDEAKYLSSLGALLERVDSRIEVELCTSAIDGLLKVGARRPDVVLLDAYMPGMDGVEVCQRVKAAPETSSVVVIATSARPSAALEQQFLAAGASGFLAKPFSADEVAQHLVRAGLITPQRASAGSAR